MGWHKVMEELEVKVEGILDGTYRPIDGIPFLRVQYPPQEEREALHQLKLFSQRLKQKGWQTEFLSLTRIFKETIVDLLGHPSEDLLSRLKEFENKEKEEILRRLSEVLSETFPNKLAEHLHSLTRDSVAFLVRTGALYPFLRPSTLLSHLEGQVSCIIVLAYPGIIPGELLNAPPSDPHGSYYRGEIIYWQ